MVYLWTFFLVLLPFITCETFTNVTLSNNGSYQYIYFSLAAYGTTYSKAELFCASKQGNLAYISKDSEIEQFSQSLSSSEVTMPVWIKYKTDQCGLLYPDPCYGSVSGKKLSNIQQFITPSIHLWK